MFYDISDEKRLVLNALLKNTHLIIAGFSAKKREGFLHIF